MKYFFYVICVYFSMNSLALENDNLKEKKVTISGRFEFHIKPKELIFIGLSKSFVMDEKAQVFAKEGNKVKPIELRPLFLGHMFDPEYQESNFILNITYDKKFSVESGRESVKIDYHAIRKSKRSSEGVTYISNSKKYREYNVLSLLDNSNISMRYLGNNTEGDSSFIIPIGKGIKSGEYVVIYVLISKSFAGINKHVSLIESKNFLNVYSKKVMEYTNKEVLVPATNQ